MLDIDSTLRMQLMPTLAVKEAIESSPLQATQVVILIRHLASHIY